MADSEFYNRAFEAYNDFLYSVFQEVSHHRQMMFKCLSEQEQDKVIWFLRHQTKSVKGSILQNIVKPPSGSFDYACIPKISEDEYVNYIDKHYKNQIMKNCMRYQDYNNDEIKSKVVSEIVDLERIKLNRILEI